MSQPLSSSSDFDFLRNVKKTAIVLLAMARLERQTGENELAQLLGYHPETIRSYLLDLLRQGLVARITRYQGYILTENGHKTLFSGDKSPLTPTPNPDPETKPSAENPRSESSSAEKAVSEQPSAENPRSESSSAENPPTAKIPPQTQSGPSAENPRSESSSAEKALSEGSFSHHSLILSAEKSTPSAEISAPPLNSINSNNNNDLKEKENLNYQTLRKLGFWNNQRTKEVAALSHVTPELIEKHVHYLLHGEGKTQTDLPLVLYRLAQEVPLPDCPCAECDPVPTGFEYTEKGWFQEQPAQPMRAPEPEPEIEWDETEGKIHPQRAWEIVKGELQYDIPKHNYETWVSPTRLASYRAGTFTIATLNDFARDWLDQRLKNTITHLLAGTMNQNVEVVFGVAG